MKNLFKYIGLLSILLFSFYYTEKISSIVVSNNSLVSEISEKTTLYNVDAVSAIIDDAYIIPGLNGQTVNVLKSYNNMKFLDAFNSYYLVYDKILPKTSLENNKDKIIKYGNSSKNSVAIVVYNNKEVIDYSISKNIDITRLISKDTFLKDSVYEQINYDTFEYRKLDNLLNNINKNTNICFINNDLMDICREKNKYLVEPSLSLTNVNLSFIKNKIKSGYIIYIDDTVNISDYKILLKQIYYQDLDIVSLSTLINEERD